MLSNVVFCVNKADCNRIPLKNSFRQSLYQSEICLQKQLDLSNFKFEYRIFFHFYRYVYANGALVTVEYIANENGYQETRTLQENFITLNDNRNGYTQPEIIKTTPKPRPVTPRPTRAPRPPPTTAAPSDDDLVARIIAQLTPFIKTTVSNSLQANQK